LVSTPLARGALSIGTPYSLDFVDIDGRKLSTADGHVTVLVLATTAEREKARAVGDRIPDFCLGNPDYRMITIVRFARKHTALGRSVARGLIRHGMTEEATRLQGRYNASGISRDAKNDVFVVTDFDASVSAQLNAEPGTEDFRVFVFGRDGKLLAQWTDVPSTDQLALVLKKQG
jgi:hypothetical protein